MSTIGVGVAHAITGAVGVSVLLPLWVMMLRWTDLKRTRVFWAGTILFGVAMAAILTSFALGFVLVAPSGQSAFSLTTPSRGSHAILGLIIAAFSGMLLVIRIAMLPHDAVIPEKSTYRAYVQIAILISLLGFACVYTSFLDYAYQVTWIWYPIYGGWIAALLIAFTIGEIVLWKQRKGRKEEGDVPLIEGHVDTAGLVR